MTPHETDPALLALLNRMKDGHPDDLSPSLRRLRTTWMDAGCPGLDRPAFGPADMGERMMWALRLANGIIALIDESSVGTLPFAMADARNAMLAWFCPEATVTQRAVVNISEDPA